MKLSSSDHDDWNSLEEARLGLNGVLKESEIAKVNIKGKFYTANNTNGVISFVPDILSVNDFVPDDTGNVTVIFDKGGLLFGDGYNLNHDLSGENTYTMKNLPSPTEPNDVSTKLYVDTINQPNATKTFVTDAIATHDVDNSAHTDIRNSVKTVNDNLVITNENLAAETTNRQNADNNLQSQIDAITAGTDVVGIVGTYAELQAYPTATLQQGDIIKVLADETHEGAASYYRWEPPAWLYVGSEAPTYTKAEINTILDGYTTDQELATSLATKVDKVVGKGLSSTDVTAVMVAIWNSKQNALTAQQLQNIADVPNKPNTVDVVLKTEVSSSATLGDPNPISSDAVAKIVGAGPIFTEVSVNGKKTNNQGEITLVPGDIGALPSENVVGTLGSSTILVVNQKTITDLKNSTNAQIDDIDMRVTLTESDITDLTTNKADKATTYTKTEVDTKDTALTAEINKKATKATTLVGYGITDAYTKTEIDGKVTTLNNSINTKATKATTLAGYGITDAYTKTATDNLLNVKANQITTYTKTETDTLVKSAKPKTATATLLASGWANKVQTLSVSGVTETNLVTAGYSSLTQAQGEAYAGAQIWSVTQGAGTLTFTAFGDVPTIDLPVNIVIEEAQA